MRKKKWQYLMILLFANAIMSFDSQQLLAVERHDTISLLSGSEKTLFDYVHEPEENLFDIAHLLAADSIAANQNDRYTHLTEEDFRIVADELDIEVAVIKAVVIIEAGQQMKGFWAPGIPVINFDASMYAKYKSKVPSKEGAKGEKVPEGLKGYALKEWTQLINARKTNAQGANMGTFWGMFQIGGFNYKLCGCNGVDEFVRLMANSELDQLELFAAFITNTKMVEDLRNKNWAAFARKYNGPSYAKRGYHTKMANAYKKFLAEENKENK